MSLGPFLKSKRSILLWIAIISVVLSGFFYQKYRDLDKNYSIIPATGETPIYAADTIKWLTRHQHPDGYFVNNPDLFDEPSILNKESVRLSRYAVETLVKLGASEQINRSGIINFVLNNYQPPSNAIGNLKGFSALPNSEVNIRATMDSVIILEQLDALGTIDTEAVAQLILAYQNNDGGFWDPGYPEFGQQSTVKATSFAVRALHHMGKLNSQVVSDERQQRINQFIQNSWSEDTKTFAPFPGHPAISSYDAYRAWVSIHYLPINQQNRESIETMMHLDELIVSLNETFRTSDKVYSEEGHSERSSLKATYLVVAMLDKLNYLKAISVPEVVQFVKGYRDPSGGFSGDIYSVYSAVDILSHLSSTRMTKQLRIYQVLTYSAILIALLASLILLALHRRVESRKHSALVRRAQTDRLTGLHNREYLEQRHSTFKDNYSHLAFILLDVDHFKSINDNHGHLAGDEVLIELSALLSNNIRKTDTLARWGGEEFAILCPATEPGHAREFSEKLRALIEAHTFTPVDNLTCSFGVACAGKNETLRDLYIKADKALYQSKRDGRNKVTYL
ncbi:diguanylate cyclase [Kangiella geojedonensis]|uniref:diguanylate cyclase n=1 Tax=Kangiella geojedonensis TaxID=914150 RepID=A0A0F6TRT1_9GAMM|nr:diguanylate cyclase [Kangiella geojedonensis]